MLSILVDDCIENGREYNNRGPRYNVVALHAGGLANVADSLRVIDQLVYRDRYIGLADFVKILRDNWEGQEPLRRMIQRRFTF